MADAAGVPLHTVPLSQPYWDKVVQSAVADTSITGDTPDRRTMGHVGH